MARDFENQSEAEPLDDPMASTDREMLPCKERDMSDVESELEAALNIEKLARAMDASTQVVDELTRQGLLFSIPHNGRDVYPHWQLDKNGHPISEFAEILATL